MVRAFDPSTTIGVDSLAELCYWAMRKGEKR
jgi:hypothetical protein